MKWDLDVHVGSDLDLEITILLSGTAPFLLILIIQKTLVIGVLNLSLNCIWHWLSPTFFMMFNTGALITERMWIPSNQ